MDYLEELDEGLPGMEWLDDQPSPRRRLLDAQDALEREDEDDLREAWRTDA
jgi:hypothetical protein